MGSGGGNGERQFLKPGRTIPHKNVKRVRETRENQVPDIFSTKGRHCSTLILVGLIFLFFLIIFSRLCFYVFGTTFIGF